MSTPRTSASNASFSVLDFARVEEFGIEGSESSSDAYHAWMNLVRLYIIQGKGAAALSAMKGLRKSHLAEEPHRRSQSRSDIDALFSIILLLAGEDEKALETIDRVLRSPDRRGSISFSRMSWYHSSGLSTGPLGQKKLCPMQKPGPRALLEEMASFNEVITVTI